MPSDFNYMDDFFRKKEQESSVGSSDQDKHWQQMKKLLVVPVHSSQGRRLTKIYWKAAAVIILTVSVSFLLLKNKKDHQSGISNEQAVRPVPTEHNKAVSIPTAIIQPSGSSKNKNSKIEKDVRSNNDRADSDSLPLSLNAASVEISTEEAFQNFFEKIKKPTQDFLIYTQRDTSIFCKEGTSVFIPAFSFQNSVGATVTGPVKFSVQEFYEMTDIISNKLSTSSDGKILVTGGMLNIEATVNDSPVVIKKASSLQVKMPTNQFDPAMQLFKGEKIDKAMARPTEEETPLSDSVRINRMNWLPVGQEQFLLDEGRDKRILVLNLRDDPYEIDGSAKTIARYKIPYDCPLSKAEIKAELIKRYPNRYDKIIVKRQWKLFKKNIYSYNWERLDGTLAPLIGDSVYMTLKEARKLQLVSKSDSIRYEEKWRKQAETAFKNNQVYQQYRQLRNQYSFKISELGWINCDKFLNYPQEQLVQFVANPGNDFNTTYFQSFLIFKNIKSVMPGSWYNGKIIFNNVPEYEIVNLVCIGIKEGKAFYTIQEVKASKAEVNNLQFHEITPDDFREKLKVFGNVTKG